MPPTTPGYIAALVAPDLRKVYFETGEELKLEYPLIYNVDSMPWNPITDRQVSGLGTMPSKGVGEQFTSDEILIGDTKTYTASAYGLAVEITYEAWEDELYGVMREMVACLARAGRNREELDAWTILNNAFSTSYPGFEAATALCSTSHTLLNGDTAANRPNPDVSLSVAGLQAGIENYHSMTDDRGLPRKMMPSMLVIDPSNMWTAREILGSGSVPYSGDNEINSLNMETMRVNVVHYLTTSTYWFLMAEKGVHDLNFFWRTRPKFNMFDDPFTLNAVATAYQRHTTGFGTWRGVYGSTGS